MCNYIDWEQLVSLVLFSKKIGASKMKRIYTNLIYLNISGLMDTILGISLALKYVRIKSLPLILILLFHIALDAQTQKKSKIQTPTSQVKACDLLTKEEVEDIIGQKIDTIEVQSGYGNCIYYKKEKFFDQLLKLPVVTVGYSRSDVQARWDYWSSVPKAEVISDLGDGAIWSKENDFLVCRVRGGLLMISVGGENDDERKNMAIKLAKKALNRI